MEGGELAAPPVQLASQGGRHRGVRFWQSRIPGYCVLAHDWAPAVQTPARGADLHDLDLAAAEPPTAGALESKS